MLAVLAYSMTVVDLALVIGPGSPPTLAVLAWTWLLDADPTTNSQGADYFNMPNTKGYIFSLKANF
jgi:putative thiamine transport system permease protein